MSIASTPSSSSSEKSLAFIEQAIADQRYETARRHCELAKKAGDMAAADYHRLLFEVGIGLADMPISLAAIQQSQVSDFEHALLQMRYYGRFNNTGAYRTSVEKAQGYTQFEYVKMMSGKMLHWYEQASQLAPTSADQDRIDDYAGMYIDVDLPPSLRQRLLSRKKQKQTQEQPRKVVTQTGQITGRITLENNMPAANVRIVLGLEMAYKPIDALTYFSSDMHYEPKIGKIESLQTQTDADGHFVLDQVPVGCHAFLAVCMDAAKYAMSTRFVARDIHVHSDRITHLDRQIRQWTSAPPKPLPMDLPTLPKLWKASRSLWERVGHATLRNDFAYDFPRQLVRLDCPDELILQSVSDEDIFVVDTQSPDRPRLCQIADGKVLCMTCLNAYTVKRLVIYRRISGDQLASKIAKPTRLSVEINQDQQQLIIDTQTAAFAFPYKTKEITGPLLALQGQDGKWRGQGRFKLSQGVDVIRQETEILEQGFIRAMVRVTYQLSDDSHFTFTFTAYDGEPTLLAHEVIQTQQVSNCGFELVMPDCLGGRGYLHWIGGNRGKCWENLAGDQDRLLARLQEQTPWWIPPQGFAYAMTPQCLEDDDLIAVFTIRRGDWRDDDFDAIAHGPVDGNRELDWPYPEMVGSTISMITAQYTAATDDHEAQVAFRFPMFKGERHWGIAVSERDLNDGVHKHLSELQHKNSSPRLDDFMRWELDLADVHPRPMVWGPDQRILEMRKTRDLPAFEHAWDRVEKHAGKPGNGGLSFLLTADPLIAWQAKIQLVAQAPIRSRMALLGREYADMYSPVGARSLTPWCEEYDALAASGIFTDDEEREVRRCFMLMGHLHRTRDFMNWNYGSRNANFEADRVDVVGTVGLVFRGNPDADDFIEHAIEQTQRGMKAYCTPASGRWYENPACYYLHAMKCRLHVLIRLAQLGLLDPSHIEILKPLLGWGILLLTPPIPGTIPQMSLPCDDPTYQSLDKFRRVAPVGDHAALGQEIPEHWAILAAYFEKDDPNYANLLRWAYVATGNIECPYSDVALYLSHTHVADTDIQATPTLTSRILEGFGSVFRDHFNKLNEFYLLFKLGPGGYRYHRTEGSIILFVDGKPLIYDGGEDGEAWRHSTLSFFDTHLPLAPGHIERFASLPNLQFSQGVNPKAIHPGEPDFLNDDCRHELVDVAFERFHCQDPVNARSVWWIKDEYVLMHDDLHLDPSTPSHWHLQVVAQSETRVAEGDYRFVGRFGTDLQVLLPDQDFVDEQVLDNTLNLGTAEKNSVPFSMRHLQVSAGKASHYTAVLRPLGSRKPVNASLLKQSDQVVGTCVLGDGIDDVLLHCREKTNVEHESLHFVGTYGAKLKRGNVTHLMLMDAGEIRVDDVAVISKGPSVELTIGQTLQVNVVGKGRVTVEHNGRTHHIESADVMQSSAL